MGKGVGDKGNVGRRDVRQAAPVGRPAVFSVSPYPGVLWPSAKRIFRVLCLPTFPPLVSLWKRAKRFSRDQGRAQTPNGTGDPREWRPSQTNRIPVSIPLRRWRTTPTGVTLRANPVDVVTVTLAACCPSSHTPAFVSTPRDRPWFSPAGRRRRGRFTVPDVTTLFSRFNRDPDYVVCWRFPRQSSIWRFKSVAIS